MKLGVMSLGDHLPDPHTGIRTSQGERLRSIVDSSVEAESLGFSMVALGEHHFNDYIISSPQLMLAAIAERTKTIRLATAVTLLATSDPVRVAEDFAMLDQLSGGRAEIVVGRGINPETYAAFGGLDPKQGHAIMGEKIQLLDQLWNSTEPFSWSGEFRGPLENVQLKPSPFAGVPRVWLGTGTTEESVRRTAEQGLPLMLPSIFGRLDSWGPLVKLYRELMTEQGKEPLVGSCSYVHVAQDSKEAHERWRPYLVNYVTWARELTGNNMPVDYDKLLAGTAMSGNPDEVADRMLMVKDVVDPDIHLAVFDVGGLPHELLVENMRLFSSEVMPKL
ncbi:LLM class flavin-dependent oxidoreductase [Prescottella defluvii]|uniref:LLM class flavin-dependent oxidoreductase n=1 Tax=Prescottella defluvii TaxID=1323361 RepID=UPI0004F39CF8|nr:LLM class flavin-dependent oxidoreductase [Prescottella defluvii]